MTFGHTSFICVIGLGEVEGCLPHHPTSVPDRMDVSMWRGVSVRLLTANVPERYRSVL